MEFTGKVAGITMDFATGKYNIAFQADSIDYRKKVAQEEVTGCKCVCLGAHEQDCGCTRVSYDQGRNL